MNITALYTLPTSLAIFSHKPALSLVLYHETLSEFFSLRLFTTALYETPDFIE
jgi:hypothetical protein